MTRTRMLFATLATAALTLASVVAPRAARADDDTLHIWGISTLGETCSGTCGASNIRCRIVIVKQVAPGP